MKVNLAFCDLRVILKDLKELLTDVRMGELISLGGYIPNEVGLLIDLSDLHSFGFIMCICLQIILELGKKISGILGSLLKSCLSVVIYADFNTVFFEE